MTNGKLQDEDDERVDKILNTVEQKFYPDQIVDFEPSGGRFSKLKDERAMNARANILFGEASYEPTNSLNRWFRNADSVQDFKIVPSEFMRKAQRSPPHKPQATASGFAQWIYSLYAKAYGDDEDREHGKEMEERILERRRFSASCIDNKYLDRAGSDWRLIHNGLHTHDTDHVSYFNIRHLSVGGSTLKASPDLVYQNRRTLEIIIVEIKYSRLTITRNLWPNVWGQLWCYSQIELALNAPKVTVIGEVWGEWWTRGIRGRKTYDPGHPVLRLRASIRRDPRAPAYDGFFQKLFDIYRSA